MKTFNGLWRESVKAIIVLMQMLTNFFIAQFKSVAFLKTVMACDNPIVRCLATRRKDKMYVLASKMNVDCALLSFSRII